MTWNQFLQEILFFTVSSAVIENLEIPENFRWEIREVTQEDCNECEYTGLVDYEIVDLITNDSICKFQASYSDGDLDNFHIFQPTNQITVEFMVSELSDLIQRATMKEVVGRLNNNFYL